MSDSFPDGWNMADVFTQPAKAHLKVFNPSPDRRRQGLVVTNWNPIAAASGVPPERLNVFAGGHRLRAQVDHLVPGDSSRDQLAILIDQPLNTGDDYGSPQAYVNVKEDDPDTREDANAELFENGAKLWNDRIEVWIHTAVDRLGSQFRCFGGAITSVLRYRQDQRPFDSLDGIAAAQNFLGHVDKRLQVDRVRLARPVWDKDDEPVIEAQLHNKPWPAIAMSKGPARACVTLASQPIPFKTTTPGGAPIECTCTVYRVISLNFGEDVVHEEMWVEGVFGDGTKADLNFTSRYFMFTDLGPLPVIFRYPSVSGWFALAAEVLSFHGYGFASNSGAGPLWTPPMDWPAEAVLMRDRAFAWELDATKRVRATHVFRFGPRERIADAAGAAWFEIFKPLTGNLA